MTVIQAPPHRTTQSRAAPRFTWADLFGPLAIFSVVAVVCLWVRNQGVASVTGERSVGSLGLLTGLLASDLMLLQVLLLARIPWVERAWGHDVLARRHRWIGFTSFWFMVAHVVLYAVESASRGGGWTWVTDLFITRPWMLMATVGTIALIGVVITSLRLARRRLRYESWHLLHLYAYLGIVFALPHQLFDGADFHGAWAQAYWWTIYLLALAAVVVFRIGLPLWRSLYHRLRVVDVRVEAPSVVSVLVKGHRLDRLKTRSGQFFIWRFVDGRGWTRGKPYTISAAPDRDQLRVTIQAVGDGSARVARVRPGTRVLIEGPYGTLTTQRRRSPRLLLIAAGVGVTPMRALLEDSQYEPGEAALIYRFTAPEQGLFADELDDIAARRGVDLHYLVGPRRADDSWLPTGYHGGDVDALTELVPDIANREVYVCGPPPWVSSLRTALRAAGVNRDQIHSEEFAW
jgi:predicted ferric reductase